MLIEVIFLVMLMWANKYVCGNFCSFLWIEYYDQVFGIEYTCGV